MTSPARSLAPLAHSQLLSHRDLSYSMAKTIAETAIDSCAAKGYAVSAVPESFNSSGRRTFYSDQTLIVRNNWSQEPATVSSAELK